VRSQELHQPRLRNHATAVESVLPSSMAPTSAREARWKAIRLLPASSGPFGPAPRGCVHTSCISASSAEIRSVRPSNAEPARGLHIAYNGVSRPCVASKSIAEFRSCLHPEDQAGARHSQSPIKAEDGTVICPLDARKVRESTHNWFSAVKMFLSRRGTCCLGLLRVGHSGLSIR
jgi:hypothetical protein